MNENYMEQLKTRYELVGRRLSALDKEKLTLESEHKALGELLEVYSERGSYDTIEEERRVTDKLIQSPKTITTPSHTRKQTYTQKKPYSHEDTLALIFEDNHGTPLTLKEITTKVNDIEDTYYKDATFFRLFERLVELNRAVRIKSPDNSKLYVYTGGTTK